MRRNSSKIKISVAKRLRKGLAMELNCARKTFSADVGETRAAKASRAVKEKRFSEWKSGGKC